LNSVIPIVSSGRVIARSVVAGCVIPPRRIVSRGIVVPGTIVPTSIPIVLRLLDVGCCLAWCNDRCGRKRGGRRWITTDRYNRTADSDEAAPLIRFDRAPGFRDDLAPGPRLCWRIFVIPSRVVSSFPGLLSSQTVSDKVDAMRVMHEAVEDRVGVSWIANDLVPG